MNLNINEPTRFSDLLQFDELFNQRLLEPLFSQWDLLIGFLPKAIAALIILLIGLVIGIVLAMITGSVLRKMGIDKLSRNAGVDAMMSEGGVKSTPSRLIGKMVFWLVFFATLMPATELLGVKELTQLTESFVVFLPKIIAAIIIVVFGFVVANFLRHTVQGSGSLGLTSTNTIGGLVYGLTVAITIVVALGQMGMDTQLLYTVLITIIASMGFAIALAVGLGGREMAHNLVAGFYARETFMPGQTLGFGEYSGVLREIRAQNALIELGNGKIIAIPNSQLFQYLVSIETQSDVEG
jgi:small-conductance mechanosensitive channel